MKLEFLLRNFTDFQEFSDVQYNDHAKESQYVWNDNHVMENPSENSEISNTPVLKNEHCSVSETFHQTPFKTEKSINEVLVKPLLFPKSENY